MFKQYLETVVNKHQLHIEQLCWAGIDSLREAINIFINFRDELLKNNISNEKYKVTVKVDGAPAVFIGRLDDKFFVSSKAILGKNPRVAYSIDDIDNDKFFSAGLKSKLKEIFPYLKQLQFDGVYQGDVLFTERSKEDKDIDGIEHITFKANTITYAVERNSDIGQEIAKAKLGLAFHTKYTGTLDNLRSEPFDNKIINNSDEIFLISVDIPSASGLLLNEEELRQINTKLSFIGKQFHLIEKELFDGLNKTQLSVYLETYINTYIKSGSMINSLNDFELWMRQKIERTPVKKANQQLKEGLDFFIVHKQEIELLLEIYLELQQIKMIFLDKFSNIKHSLKSFIITDTSIEPTNPEGFCIVNMENQSIYKFVDRLNFSKQNFNAIKNWNGDTNV